MLPFSFFGKSILFNSNHKKKIQEMNLISKIKIKDALNAKYKILRIWILLGILFEKKKLFLKILGKFFMHHIVLYLLIY